ncbi:MAG: hypothetical protein WCB04_07095, partial [Mycobacteriales bacterium]
MTGQLSRAAGRIAMLLGASGVLAVVGFCGSASAAAAQPLWGWPLPGRPAVVRPFDPPATDYGAG